jgi:hypothetical protein
LDDVGKSFEERWAWKWAKVEKSGKAKGARAEKSKRSGRCLLNSKAPSLLKLRK